MEPTTRRRSTRERRAGLGRAGYLARRMAVALVDRRRGLRLSQREVAERAGVSQREVSRLELGQGANTNVDIWAAVGAALGLQLAAYFERAPGATRPDDLEHLRRQDLVIRTAAHGGWAGSPESLLLEEGRYPRSIDVLLRRPATREAAVVEVWDLITDGGAAMRGLEVKVRATRERLGPDWRVRGLLVVRGTQRNRRLVGELRALFAARYPASSAAWLRALSEPGAAMPDADGLAWTDVAGTRLIAARLRSR
jgi:transcriptional regulator with XRE-family HTH domain